MEAEPLFTTESEYALLPISRFCIVKNNILFSANGDSLEDNILFIGRETKLSEISWPALVQSE